MLFKIDRTLRAMGLCLTLLIAITSLGFAADEAPTTEADPAEAAPNLAATQEAIEMKYRRFEGTLQQLSEYLRKTDPARAELLVRAIGRSKEGRIPEQMQGLTELLKKDQLGDAVERQEIVVTELQSLLELLMSEARKDDLELEKKRIQDLMKDVTKLIGKESEARAETERGNSQSPELQDRQKQIAESTLKLVQKIAAQDAAKKSSKNDKNSKPSDQAKPAEGEPDEKDSKDKPKADSDETKPPSESEQKEESPNGEKKSKPGDGKSGKEKSPEKKPSDSPNGEPDDKNQDDQKKDEPKTSDEDKPETDEKDASEESQKPDSKGGKPQQGKPSQSKPQKGKPQEGQEQDQPQENPPQDSSDPQDPSQEENQDQEKPSDKTPGRDELQRAKQEMDRAVEELKKSNKKGASDKQDKAIAALMKALEKLESILRQVREEERELVLAQMEARFRDMLQKQEAVYNATLALHAVPPDNRTDRHRGRAVELSRNEDEIAVLAAKALTLLKEEGSSIAFPEAVEQIRDDMLTVARRLERVDVGEITQNIEQDTIESLKELIESLQKEIEKMKDKKQPPQQQQRQQQQEQKGLVEKLAEMKMLRSLQFRVNRRTKQLGRLVDGEQAADQDVITQLRQLSDRQAKVQKATYDLSIKKNQ